MAQGVREFLIRIGTVLGHPSACQARALMNEAWVSRKVEFSTRVENLSWSHHRAVAPLPPEEQERWLEKAAPEPGQKRAWVSKSVEFSLRKENLSHSHHMAVAPLPPEEQERWLSEAAPSAGEKKAKLTVAELRESIKTERDELQAGRGYRLC